MLQLLQQQSKICVVLGVTDIRLRRCRPWPLPTQPTAARHGAQPARPPLGRWRLGGRFFLLQSSTKVACCRLGVDFCSFLHLGVCVEPLAALALAAWLALAGWLGS